MSPQDFSKLGFCDLKAGDRFSLGERSLTREEMIEFASKYDPRPFHLSEEAARAHPLFEDLSASGWLTVLILQEQVVRFWERTKVRGLAGAGVDGIKWELPVYAGEVLNCELEVEMIRVSASKPQLGIMTMCLRASKQDGRLATLARITGIFENDGALLPPT